MNRIAVAGASGFVGRYLLRHLQTHSDCSINALYRASNAAPADERVQWHRGDVRDPAIWSDLLAGCTALIYLVHVPDLSEEDVVAMAKSLGKACRDSGVLRIILCSTAAVAGATSERRVTETSRCVPRTPYERQKLAFEQQLHAACGADISLSILRPSAVFGPGGRNLMKLAHDASRGAPVVNWLRSSLFGGRRMHLVPVENVAAALSFLAHASSSSARGVFICSEDDDPANNFRDVELRLRSILGVRPHALPPLSLPDSWLRQSLRLLGRSATDPGRIYDTNRLLAMGFRRTVGFSESLDRFGRWYSDSFLSGPSKSR